MKFRKKVIAFSLASTIALYSIMPCAIAEGGTAPFSVNDNPFKYSSYYQDSESGLYYLKARYYSPDLMRFISRDTYDLSNRYAYGDGDPVSNIDPDGHMAKWLNFMFAGVAIIGGIAGAMFSGGTSLAGGLAIAGGTLGAASGDTQLAASFTHGKTSKRLGKASFGLGITGMVVDAFSIGVGVSQARSAKLSANQNVDYSETEKNTFTSAEEKEYKKNLLKYQKFIKLDKEQRLREVLKQQQNEFRDQLYQMPEQNAVRYQQKITDSFLKETEEQRLKANLYRARCRLVELRLKNMLEDKVGLTEQQIKYNIKQVENFNQKIKAMIERLKQIKAEENDEQGLQTSQDWINQHNVYVK